MPDELDRNFVNKDDAKAEIRAAVKYLLRGAAGGARGDIVREIIEIVREVANGEQQIPWTMACPVAEPIRRPSGKSVSSPAFALRKPIGLPMLVRR